MIDDKNDVDSHEIYSHKIQREQCELFFENIISKENEKVFYIQNVLSGFESRNMDIQFMIDDSSELLTDENIKLIERMKKLNKEVLEKELEVIHYNDLDSEIDDRFYDLKFGMLNVFTAVSPEVESQSSALDEERGEIEKHIASLKEDINNLYAEIEKIKNRYSELLEEWNNNYNMTIEDLLNEEYMEEEREKEEFFYNHYVLYPMLRELEKK